MNGNINIDNKSKMLNNLLAKLFQLNYSNFILNKKNNFKIFISYILIGLKESNFLFIENKFG